MEKRADFGARTLVTVILTVIAFIILLVFLFKVVGQGTIDKEACHQSVIFRGTVPTLVENYVPLNCKTEKICLTNKLIGGSCEDFENSKGVTYVRINDKEQVEKTIAQGMIDCWSMMGEGKVSIFSQYWAGQVGVGSIYPSCVVCSRIAFDKKNLKGSNIDLSEIDVEKYMATHAISDKEISYLEYVAGQNNAKLSVSEDLKYPNLDYNINDKGEVVGLKPSTITTESTIELLSAEELALKTLNEKKDFEIQSDELAILFMQISSPKHGDSLVSVAKLFAGGTFAAGSTIGFVNTAKVGKNVATKACGSPWGSVICIGAAIAAVFVQQANVASNRNIAAGYCGDILLGDNAREGCSVVRTVNYDDESIRAYCSVIESTT